MSDLRSKILLRLNELLELDHDTIQFIMVDSLPCAVDSDLKDHPVSNKEGAMEMIDGLDILAYCADIEPIKVEWENEIMQKFY